MSLICTLTIVQIRRPINFIFTIIMQSIDISARGSTHGITSEPWYNFPDIQQPGSYTMASSYYCVYVV